MGNGKKKIEIKKIEKDGPRMVTFSKRRKGLFKKAQEYNSMTGANVAVLVFSPAGNPYTYGDVGLTTAALFNTFSGNNGSSINGLDHHFGAGNSAARTSISNGLRGWLDSMDIESCHRVDDLLQLKQQLQEIKEKIVSMDLPCSVLH